MPTSSEPNRAAKPLLVINALSALTGVCIGLYLMCTGFYVNNVDVSKPTLIGNSPTGVDQVWERFFDWITYFTNLSNVVVLATLILLLVRPKDFERTDSVGRWLRALRLDSVLMITVTGIVYNLLLASGEKTGIDAVSNAFLHNITPIVTVLVWLVAGPRGLIQPKTIGLSLVLPTAWAAFALVRGAAIGAYPYPFFDVSTHGLAAVLAFVAQIVVFALVLALALFGADRLLSRSRH